MYYIKPSQLFEKLTNRHYLYNICPIVNIPSIIEYGLLSYNQARAFNHSDISLSDAQDKRSNVLVPNGKPLHDYVNLYFDAHNPMLSKCRKYNNDICVLVLDSSVLDIEGAIITDSNAASPYVLFDDASNIEKLDFDTIYMNNWNSLDKFEYHKNKARKCAEVLVPNSITYKHIVGAIVLNEKVKQDLLDIGFNKKIEIDVNYKLFFKGGY